MVMIFWKQKTTIVDRKKLEAVKKIISLIIQIQFRTITVCSYYTYFDTKDQINIISFINARGF